jgi:hypothetical protein
LHGGGKRFITRTPCSPWFFSLIGPQNREILPYSWIKKVNAGALPTIKVKVDPHDGG